jgi:molybdenum cofactor cytidylyltransferase
MTDARAPRSFAAENKPIGIIVLAAGGSSRMGEPKQLLRFQNKTLLRRAVETAIESVYEPVVVVLGANFEKARAEIEDLPAEIVLNAHWQSGLSSSLKAGIENLQRIAPAAAACVVALADQPFVCAAHLNRLEEEFRQNNYLIVAARYHGTVGVPALFSRACFDDFRALAGDKGAKPVIAKHAAAMLAVDLPEAAFDLDTPEDLNSLFNP